MKYCQNCGAENNDSMPFCVQCGAKLMAVPVSAKGKKQRTRKTGAAAGVGGGSGALKVVGIILGIAAVIALGVFAVLNLVPGAVIGRGAVRTSKELKKQLDKNTYTVQALSTMSKEGKKGAYNLNLKVQSSDFTVSSEYNYSRSKGIASGRAGIDYPDKDLDLLLDFAANKKQLQLSMPGKSFNVYGFKYKDLAKKYNSSFLSKLIPANIPEELNIDTFDISAGVDNFAKNIKDWASDFKKSLDIEKLDKRSVNIGSKMQTVSVYKVTWSERAASEFAAKADGFASVTGLSEVLHKIITSIEPSCLCYVNRAGQLIGIDCVVVGNQYLFLLEGEDNIWDKFTLSNVSAFGNNVSFNGGLKKNTNGAEFYLSNENEQMFRADFSDNGDFSISTRSFGTLVSGSIYASSTSADVTLRVLPDVSSDFEASVKLTKQTAKPVMISESYIDLLNLNINDLQRLLLDIGMNIA